MCKVPVGSLTWGKECRSLAGVNVALIRIWPVEMVLKEIVIKLFPLFSHISFQKYINFWWLEASHLGGCFCLFSVNVLGRWWLAMNDILLL